MNCRPEDLLEDPPDGRVEFSGLQISAINFLHNPGSSEDKAEFPQASNLFRSIMYVVLVWNVLKLGAPDAGLMPLH